MALDELLHVVLGEIIGLDVGLHELFVGDGSQVGQLVQLHEELLEVQLHQRPALVAALLHVGVAAGQNAQPQQQRAISIFPVSRRCQPPPPMSETLITALGVSGAVSVFVSPADSSPCRRATC